MAAGCWFRSQHGPVFCNPVVGRFLQEHPNVNVNLNVTNQKGLIQLLENNENGYRINGRAAGRNSLVSEPLLDNPL